MLYRFAFSLWILSIVSCQSEQRSSTVGINQTDKTAQKSITNVNPSREIGDSSETNTEELIDEILSLTTDLNNKNLSVPYDPPLTDAEINNVLQLCIQQLLTSSEFKLTRDFYGTPGSTEVILVTNSEIKWPATFLPKVNGVKLQFAQPKTIEYDGNRILGIRLSKLDLTAPVSDLFDGNIIFVLSNVGGSKNGAVHGGCFTYFSVVRQGKEYIARCTGLIDP
ncbi:hypothetical protein [Gimesia chilikensis]|uniref:hypothetical protein n=1 Tax=Gimesia chilikensis TaxID=2605989 RepID=UPI00118ACB8F|nr:hypothetical protein [Gimesia chilikensis]QDT85966.1 hypothetical protein MalM14_36380 [Gimesia chilikensis]